MRRMTGLTFARLTELKDTRDMARVFLEAERARNSEMILAKAMKRIDEILRDEKCQNASCNSRIKRVVDAALLEIQ